jgi:hypothetical protein
VTRARALILVVIIVAFTACASKAPLSGPRADADAKQVLRKYIDAMKREDFAAANALRCSAARANVNDAQYKVRFHRLLSTLGSIEAVDVTTGGTEKLVPIADLPGQIRVRYRLVTNLGQHKELIVMTALENGKRVLCGWITSEGVGLFPHGVLIAAGDPTKVMPRDLLVVKAPPGGRPYEDKAIPRDTSDPGQLDGWTRGWRIGDYGGATMAAARYVSPDSSLSAAADRLKHLEGLGNELFHVPGVPNAVGIRTVMFTEFWLQDSATPPFVDTVYAVFGNEVIYVGVSNLTTRSHAIAIRLMQEIAARAK